MDRVTVGDTIETTLFSVNGSPVFNSNRFAILARITAFLNVSFEGEQFSDAK